MRSLLQRQTEPVLVYDHHQPAFDALCAELTPAERERLQLASSAKDVAERCDVTCLMVPGPPEMEAVCLGELLRLHAKFEVSGPRVDEARKALIVRKCAWRDAGSDAGGSAGGSSHSVSPALLVMWRSETTG